MGNFNSRKTITIAWCVTKEPSPTCYGYEFKQGDEMNLEKYISLVATDIMRLIKYEYKSEREMNLIYNLLLLLIIGCIGFVFAITLNKLI